MSKDLTSNKEKEETIEVDASAMVEAIQYLVTKERVRNEAFYQKVRDIQMRAAVKKDSDYLEDLMTRLKISTELIKNKDEEVPG